MMAGVSRGAHGPREVRRRLLPESGFTLVELAIVLVLIGLLLGALLLGNGILTQSRIKFIANDFEQIKIAILTYQDRYGALPGDDTRAASRWITGGGAPRAMAGTGDGRIGGSYQAPPPAGDPMVSLVIDPASAPVPGNGESLNFWWHLRLAELVIAPPPVVTPVAQPLNHFAGVVGVEWAVLGFPRLAVCTSNLPGEIAIGVESQLDDGNPRRGLIRAAKHVNDNDPIAAADATATTYATGDADMYIICRRLD
jgi:prepilin-type N-terminal cleavage/methylation domain-containing protein